MVPGWLATTPQARLFPNNLYSFTSSSLLSSNWKSQSCGCVELRLLYCAAPRPLGSAGDWLWPPPLLLLMQRFPPLRHWCCPRCSERPRPRLWPEPAPEPHAAARSNQSSPRHCHGRSGRCDLTEGLGWGFNNFI